MKIQEICEQQFGIFSRCCCQSSGGASIGCQFAGVKRVWGGVALAIDVPPPPPPSTEGTNVVATVTGEGCNPDRLELLLQQGGWVGLGRTGANV